MELEHTNLGSHCEAECCNQRDFLPFTCDVCNKKYCLAHRTYQAHSCVGASSKDMTSIECPICLKTVKYAMSDNVDAVWNDHYLNGCSGEPTKMKTIKVCSKPSCNVRLGPSNTFECKSCRQQVCMSHRRPDDHDCKGMRGAVLSKMTPPVTTSTQAKPASSKPVTGSSSSSSSQQRPGTATSTPSPQPATSSASASAKKTPASTSASSSMFGCPFCGLWHDNGSQLERHIADQHPDPSTSRSSSSSSSTRPATATAQSTPKPTSNGTASAGHGREVCPICQARFVDPVELVSHFEQVHPSSGPGGNAGAGGETKNDCCIS